MRFSEIKGEEAFDVLADIMEPAVEIFSDQTVVAFCKSRNFLKAIQIMLKQHKKSVMTMLAIVDREDPETYEPNVLTLPIKLLEILNDPDLQQLFFWQEQTGEATSSGSATENIEAKEM